MATLEQLIRKERKERERVAAKRAQEEAEKAANQERRRGLVAQLFGDWVYDQYGLDRSEIEWVAEKLTGEDLFKLRGSIFGGRIELTNNVQLLDEKCIFIQSLRHGKEEWKATHTGYASKYSTLPGALLYLAEQEQCAIDEIPF